jgi:glutamine synthetase
VSAASRWFRRQLPASSPVLPPRGLRGQGWPDCGLLGLNEGLTPEEPIQGSAKERPFGLPRGLLEAVALFADCEPLHEVFGKSFVSTFRAIKIAEFETFMRVISPWEREYLLLNV